MLFAYSVPAGEVLYLLMRSIYKYAVYTSSLFISSVAISWSRARASLLRRLYIANEQWFPNHIPMYFWLDYLAEDRITALDILPREFGLMPTRMTQNIGYLREE